MRFNLDFLIVPSCDLDMTANVHVKKMADIFCINTQKSDLTWFHNNINFYNINELIKRGYDFSINTMTDSTDKTEILLEQFLQKSDALDEKLTRIENNLKMQIRDIKVNLESHKLQKQTWNWQHQKCFRWCRKKPRLNLAKVWRTKHQNRQTNARQ